MDTLASEFPEVAGLRLETLKELFKGEAVGQRIWYTWWEEGVQEVYSRKIESLQNNGSRNTELRTGQIMKPMTMQKTTT